MTANRLGWLTGVVCAAALLGACGGAPPPQKAKRHLRTTFECPRDKALSDEEALRIAPEALPQVWTVLEQVEQKECWAAAVRIAGFAGGPEAFARLQAYVESRAPLFARSEELVQLQNAFIALGHLVRLNKHERASKQALQYLVESTDPLNWVKRSIDWDVDAVIRREIIRTITRSAVVALGMTGDEEARSHLLAMALDAAERRAYDFRFQTSENAIDQVEALIKLQVLPPGRVVFALGHALGTLPAGLDADVQDRARRAHEQARRTWALEREWLETRRDREGFERLVRQADAVADARLSGFHGQLDSLRHLMDEPEAHRAIDEIGQLVFPEGPLELINTDYAEQVQRVLAAMERLQRERPEQVTRLRLQPHVATVIDAHLGLRRALESGKQGAGFEKVIQARADLQNQIRVLIATAVARYPGWTEGDQPMRDAVVGPLVEQSEQVESYLRRRVAVRDVNPDTGQELAPLEAGRSEEEQAAAAEPSPAAP